MNEKLDIMDFKKPDNMTAAQWKGYKENGLKPCQVKLGLNYCGQPAYTAFADLKETTVPGDGVINYRIIKMNYFCPEHVRECVYINADGTVTFGKNSFELAVELEEKPNGSNRGS
jgi:hypothetical protein